MMNKSLRARAPESSRNRFYGFQRPVFRRSPDAPTPNANFGTTKAPGNLMTLMPLFGSGSRSRRDHSGDDAKKRAAVSGGF